MEFDNFSEFFDSSLESKNAELVKAAEEFLSEYKEANSKPRKKGCLMLYLSEQQTAIVKKLQAKIKQEDLYTEEEGYGLETEPHTTVLYGFVDDSVASNIEQMLAEHKLDKPVFAVLKDISTFENDNYDVLKISLISGGLNKLNAFCRNHYSYENDYDKYNPHITIAYLKKGTAKKYLKALKVPHVNFKLSNFVYSDKDSTKTYFTAGKKKLKISKLKKANNYNLVHYSRNKYPQLNPLTYEALIKDRTSGRWENLPDKAKQYVKERQAFEKALHSRLAARGIKSDPATSFLYATLDGMEQFGKPSNYKHTAPLSDEIINSSFFDVVGDGKYRTVFGQKGLQQAIKRWTAAKESGNLNEEEYMGMKIRPRIEVMTQNKISPTNIEFINANNSR